MRAIKFDEVKVVNCIQAYHDQHGEYPYLIMCKETANILPSDVVTVATTASTVSSTVFPVPDIVAKWSNNITVDNTKPEQISIDNEKYTRANVTDSSFVWHNCKVLIDNGMKFGEVHIG